MRFARILAVAALATTAVVFAAGPAGADAAPPRILVVESAPPTTTNVDAGTPGNGTGDYTTFYAEVSRKGRPIGWLYGTKTIVALPGQAGAKSDQGIFTNLLTFVLPDGTITIGGLQSAVLGPTGYGGSGDPAQRAIVGGTGRYAGAGGVLFTTDSKTIPNGRTQRFVFSSR